MGASVSGLTREPFSQEEIYELFTDSGLDPTFVFKKIQKEGVVSFDSLVKFVDSMTDCFMTHDWGQDEVGRSNHERVKRFNALLKERHGISTWFDEDEMSGDVKGKMRDGIDGTRCMVVFITDKYIDKVDGKGPAGDKDNCRYEFTYAERVKGSSSMVSVGLFRRL